MPETLKEAQARILREAKGESSDKPKPKKKEAKPRSVGDRLRNRGRDIDEVVDQGVHRRKKNQSTDSNN